MVSLIGLPAVQYPRNALLDFSPVASAVENYQQQEAINRRMAMEGERLGFERENQGFRRERHPLELTGLRTQNDAATAALAQNRLLYPLQVRQTQAQVETAEDTLADLRQRRREADAMLGIGVPTGGYAPSVAPSSVPGVTVTQPAPAQAPFQAQPPRPAQAPAAPAAAPAPASQPQPNVNEAGARFIQEHILSVLPEIGQQRFSMLAQDPVFGPAIQAHGLHQMPWRNAAMSMAGVDVTPTTQPAPQPAASPAPSPQTAPTPAGGQRRLQDIVAGRSDVEQSSFWRTWRESPTNAIKMLMEWENPKLEIKEVGGRLVATDPHGRLPARVVYDPASSPDVGTVASIQGGLTELASIPGRYGGDEGVFSRAVGPFQGDPTDYSGFSAFSPSSVAQGVARAMGSLDATLRARGQNANAAPAEVRRAIEGATNTVAAVLKPLIRKPGEGAWSDRDQAVLNTIIGNLTQASTVEQYNRELENVRQRINANFRLDLPPIPGVTPVQRPNQTQGQSGVATPTPRISNDAEYNALPSGTRFLDPNGRTRIKP